ncbi:conserved hypothetical protein [Ricinus communis]|uniref:Uncharacterized protein n=1 Tax=Ricinus communis TaxID=3988 RepID=B9RGJ4_RICCO|nr:conserved hypothetical protein [Ricinus communis]
MAMSFTAAASSPSHLLVQSQYPKVPFPFMPTPISSRNFFLLYKQRGRRIHVAAVKSNSSSGEKSSDKEKKIVEEEEEEEVEEELGWIQEKALDLVEFTGSVTQAIPGPRVGQSSLPWILALPLGYLGITFVIAFVKTVKKYSSPRDKRKRLVNKNAMLCKSIDELFHQGGDALHHSALKELEKKRKSKNIPSAVAIKF